MRTLSSTLLQAQQASSSHPYVKVEVRDRIAGVARLAFSRLYEGGEPDYHHAATCPGDGSLCRARVAPTTYDLYYQRVASPGPGSNFSSWSLFYAVSSVSGLALCSRGATVIIFSVAPDQVSLRQHQSNDYGATFGSVLIIGTAPGAVGWMAAAINPSGVVGLFFSVGATVYVMKRVGGWWDTPQAWTNSVAAVRGLAVYYQGDWNLALAGEDSSGKAKVWTCIYGDGASQGVGTWSALREVTMASSGSQVEFRCPSLALADVPRMFFVEKYTGSQSYSRPNWSHSLAGAAFADNLWREPVPFNASLDYGLALAATSSYAWLSCPSGVWRAALQTSTLDLTPDVLSVSLQEDPGMGRGRVELRNDDGRYNSPGSSSLAALHQGAELQVSLGYITSAGAEASPGPALEIDGWEYLPQGTFAIYGRDGWGLLEDWKARRQFRWNADRTVYQLLAFVLARAGLSLSSLSTSSLITSHSPEFTIHPEESGAVAVNRLLAMVPDVLFFRGTQPLVKNPLSSEASAYSYGGSHAILQGRYASRSLLVNRVQVYGQGIFYEGFSWGEVEKLYDRLRQVHDLNLGSLSLAQGRGEAELRRADISALGGEILAPVNCGQELYDVIEITDAKAGLQGAKRRVVGFHLEYSGGKYQHRLLLGGV